MVTLLKKCIFAIALAEGATLFDRHQSQKPKRVAMKNRGKVVAFSPNRGVFVFAKDDNPKFCSNRIEILITFDI